MSSFKNTGRGLFLMLMLWQGTVCAQEVKMYQDKAPTAEEMGGVLFSSEPNKKTGSVKMRSISFGKPKNAKLDPSEPVTANHQISIIGLPIKFGYDSAEILEQSKPYLNEVGKMLGLSNFKNEKLLIEGHTDASGSEAYNRALSERRARSVKKYLRVNFNIASDRLFVSGLGESKGLPGVSANSAVNRRVQFRKAP